MYKRKRKADEQLAEEAKHRRTTEQERDAEATCARELADARTCCVCTDGESAAMFLPCKDICCCMQRAAKCHTQQGACPVCSEQVAETLRVYFA